MTLARALWLVARPSSSTLGQARSLEGQEDGTQQLQALQAQSLQAPQGLVPLQEPVPVLALVLGVQLALEVALARALGVQLALVLVVLLALVRWRPLRQRRLFLRRFVPGPDIM